MNSEIEHSTGPLHKLAIALVLALTATLAITSLVQDSLTYDETSHLTSGYSYLQTGDYRLAPDHPPLAKMWAALPVWLMGTDWPMETAPGWRDADVWKFGRMWLFELNDGQKLVTITRLMIVPLLLATCVCIYLVTRKLFGAGAGLLALIVAGLSSTLLAHGRLVTTDIPVTLCFLLTLLAWAALLRQITWGRLLSAAAATAALALTKFSWPLVLPAIGLMTLIAIFRSEPLLCALMPERSLRQERLVFSLVSLASRLQRVVVIVGATIFVAVFVWLTIWTCFAFRFDAARRGGDWKAAMGRIAAGDWLLEDAQGVPLPGVVPEAIRWARNHHSLPDAYLCGLAYTYKSTRERNSYFMGAVGSSGWRSYFPIAFGIKTELSILVLTLAGAMALGLRRVGRVQDPLLLAGLAAFTLVYAWSAVTGHLNIGHRHILPIYPAIFVLAGAAAAWGRTRVGQFALAGVLVWLLVSNARIYPQYLCYFNELVGGPANGHRYLADSNIDWGQDLKRLAAWSQQHPNETVKLAYFGTADPIRYGINCEMLSCTYPFAKPATLTEGTYIASVTQLLGVYEEAAQDAFWADAKNVARYRQLSAQSAAGIPASQPATATAPDAPETPAAEYQRLRSGRVLNRLQHRQPDERVGYSLFVYHLNQSDVDEMIRP